MTGICQKTATEIAAAVRSKAISATEVARAHLERISSVNPAINAVVQALPDEALLAAKTVDEVIARGEDPGVLCGVPVTIKVNVDQKGQATTNGLKLQEKLIAEADSPVVSNIRKAGGVIVGRTNTPAFSLRWFTKNDLHGQTLNPRNKAITPGGSSGGASAAVAAGLCAIGHGTDIAGSVRYPAYACGLHGLRPTLGRIPAYNASAPDRFIGAQLMAVSGPIARSISDLEIAMAAMTASDVRDPWHVPVCLSGGEFPKRAALSLAPDGMEVSDQVSKALIDAAGVLKDAGWDVEEAVCPSMRAAADINATLWMAETHFGARKLIEQEAEADSQFVFQQMSEDIGEIGLEDLMKALQARITLIREWELFFQRFPVLICPVSGQMPFAQQQDVSSGKAFAEIMEAQLTQRALPALGMPALSVATGEVDNIPVGVQLVAARYREETLLAAGQALENVYNTPTVVTPDWD